jgi:hypothetical protein
MNILKLFFLSITVMHLGATEHSKVPDPSFTNSILQSVKDMRAYKKTSFISSMFFGLLSPKHPVTVAETGIFSLGALFFWSSVFIPNKERLKTAVILFGIALSPHIFSLRRQEEGPWKRKDTLFSQSASALSLVAASYYLKTQCFK